MKISNQEKIEKAEKEQLELKELDDQLRDKDFDAWLEIQREQDMLTQGTTSWYSKYSGRANYTGEMRQGRACGYGTVLYESPKEDYDYAEHKGSFDNNIKNGKGVQITKSGDRFEGTWKNDVPNGKFVVKDAVTKTLEEQFYKSGKKINWKEVK